MQYTESGTDKFYNALSGIQYVSSVKGGVTEKTKQIFMKTIILFFISSVCISLYLRGQDAGYVNRLEIGIEEKLDEYVPEDIAVISQDNDTLILGSIISKPTVLSLVYYRCPGICSPLMNGIADVIQKSDMKIGDEYQVLTISFDPRETPELAKRKRMNYLSQVTKPEAADGWFFFTADSTNIALLTDAVGFRYKQSGNDFTHAASIIILSPEGKITRYLNGIQFLPFEFKMAIVEASKGQSGPTINKILQFCYSYDPKGQQYVLNITRVSGIIIIFIALTIFLILALRPLLKSKMVAN